MDFSIPRATSYVDDLQCHCRFVLYHLYFHVSEFVRMMMAKWRSQYDRQRCMMSYVTSLVKDLCSCFISYERKKEQTQTHTHHAHTYTKQTWISNIKNRFTIIHMFIYTVGCMTYIVFIKHLTVWVTFDSSFISPCSATWAKVISSRSFRDMPAGRRLFLT